MCPSVYRSPPFDNKGSWKVINIIKISPVFTGVACLQRTWETYNDLLIRGNELQSLLYDPAAIHLQSQGQDMSPDPLCQSQLLVQAAKLKCIKSLISTHPFL